MIYCVCFFSIIVNCLEAEGIIGGNEASIGQFPYVVSLQNELTAHVCGGGIIEDKFVLTAAHCVVKTNGQFNETSYIVVAGIINILQSTTKEIEVEKIYIPRNYTASINSSKPTDADIAVLKVYERS